MSKIMGDINPAEELLRGLTKPAEPKTVTVKQDITKEEGEPQTIVVKSETIESEPKTLVVKSKKAEGKKKKERKKYYRVNLALTETLGETIKAEAEKQNRSVNNYIETILQEYLSREEK